MQLYNIRCNYVIGQKLIRGMDVRGGLQQECVGEHFQYKFGCGEDICSGVKSKHVRIQAYLSIPGVYLEEGEDSPPLPQNCKNILPWFSTMLILKCT